MPVVQAYSNPLKEYMDVTGLNPKEVGKMCRIGRQSVVDISRMKPAQIARCRVGTLMNITKGTNVDLLKFLKEIYRHNRKV